MSKLLVTVEKIVSNPKTGKVIEFDEPTDVVVESSGFIVLPVGDGSTSTIVTVEGFEFVVEKTVAEVSSALSATDLSTT
jgi:hypothetical protein